MNESPEFRPSNEEEKKLGETDRASYPGVLDSSSKEKNEAPEETPDDNGRLSNGVLPDMWQNKNRIDPSNVFPENVKVEPVDESRAPRELKPGEIGYSPRRPSPPVLGRQDDDEPHESQE